MKIYTKVSSKLKYNISCVSYKNGKLKRSILYHRAVRMEIHFQLHLLFVYFEMMAFDTLSGKLREII